MNIKDVYNRFTFFNAPAIGVTALLIFFNLQLLKSQDTITMMQYNLLSYGVNTSYCTSTNNNVATKEQNFKKIVKYVNPTILTVNEMGASATMADGFLTNVLNTDGISYYQRASLYNSAGSDIINMLYYDSRKIKYHSHKTISAYIRDIDLYKLYHNSPDLSVTHDTTFIYCAVAHLKAGSTAADLSDRKTMTQYAMANLSSYGIVSNIMFMGDFNTRSSSEDCFQNLITNTNTNINFNDPINHLGDWYSNSSFKNYHTQSTNVTSNDCISGGGFDDRFDFILINNAIKNFTLKVKYISNSYKALGQDGNRYNKSIISPSNTAVPTNIANALFYASDHLPVVLKLLVDRLPAETGNLSSVPDYFINYNFNNDILMLNISAIHADVLYLNFYNITGQLLYSTKMNVEKGINTFSLNDYLFGKGLNLVQFTNKEKTFISTVKVVNL